MENNIFKTSSDAALFMHSVLKRLGSGDVDNFTQRLESQKMQYFAQLFGVSPKYPYNLYARGPYSPDLAHDLFVIKDKKIKVKTEKFVSDELEDRFMALQEFIKGKSIRILEVAATLHWLVKEVKLSKSEAEKRLIFLKNTTENETSNAFNILNALPDEK